MIEKLINNNTPLNINAIDLYGRFPLSVACKKENLTLVKLLIGTTPNNCNKNGFSALMQSCLLNNLPITKYLISNGADSYIKDIF